MGFVSIEKIYNTLETMFHRLSKHPEFRQKYSAARRILLLHSFRYAVTKVWNMLPDDIRTSQSLIAFKRAIQDITV